LDLKKRRVEPARFGTELIPTNCRGRTVQATAGKRVTSGRSSKPPSKVAIGGLRASSRGRLTLDDIAHRLGVSSITISRAFRQPEKVSPRLLENILKTAREMGYVSSRAASSLASAQSRNIVVLVPSLGNAVFVDLLRGIDKVLRQRGYQMLLGITNYSQEEEDALVRAYLAFDPDGLLVTGINYSEGTGRLLEQINAPIVHMMELYERNDVNCVGFSQEAAAAAMTEHLLTQGRRRIGFIASQLDSRTLARHRGYKSRMRAAGLYDARRELLVPDSSSIALGGVLLGRILEQAPDVDALFFCNDDLAHGALFECLRRKIRVPQELAICGFNDLPASACTVPTLTTVATPRFEIGVQSATMLIALIERQPVASRQIDLGFELRHRHST
jgi:LacI family transcriptional regulator, gluconate utilization system Gnt-I transcriptional repressor